MGPNTFLKACYLSTLLTLSTNYPSGIAYQLTEKDPLLNTEQCQRDASLMMNLGANAIRVYHVDPSGDHSGCMKAFASAGIYLLVDLDTFTTAIDPVSSPSHPVKRILISPDRRYMEPNSIRRIRRSHGYLRRI
jgi:hypothetical protein